MSELAFFIDHFRCIECEACVAACSAREAMGASTPLALDCGAVQ
jgi:Fe-S-cluster-containing dehydrogenase component